MSNLGQRNVAYWSIDTPIEAYGVADPLAVSADKISIAATMRTRLNQFSPAETDLLLTVGYAGADAALRARAMAINVPNADFSGLPVSITTQARRAK